MEGPPIIGSDAECGLGSEWLAVVAGDGRIVGTAMLVSQLGHSKDVPARSSVSVRLVLHLGQRIKIDIGDSQG